MLAQDSTEIPRNPESSQAPPEAGKRWVGNCIFKWVLSQRTGAGTESQRAGVRDQERRARKPGWAYGRRAATRSSCSRIGGKNTFAAADDPETAVRATAVVL